jgi:hypothetical protein
VIRESPRLAARSSAAAISARPAPRPSIPPVDDEFADISIRIPGEVLALGQAHHACDMSAEHGHQHGVSLVPG